MEIRDYQPGDEDRIVSLFELVYGRAYSMNQWKWRFRENPAGSHLIKLMWEGDQLVGHYAVSPILLNVGGRNVKTCHSLATMTHPEYGRRGIFKSLADALYHDLENKLGYEAIWGYPNINSHYGFKKNLGWEDIGMIHTMRKSREKVGSCSSHNLLQEESTFTDFHETLFNQKLKNSGNYVLRNTDYLNWRYFKKPSVDYKLFTSIVNESPALFVTKVYPAKSPGEYTLNLVEAVVADFTKLDEYIEQIASSYDLPIDSVTAWVNLWDGDYQYFEKSGFTPDQPLTYLSARTIPSLRNQFLHFPNWYISMGDSDVF